MAGYEAVLIPGGGVREGGELTPWVRARFERALEISGSPYLMPLSAGTTRRPPPLDARGFPISEAHAGARYLLSRGVEARRILVESSSYDTMGNAYFSRVVHVIPRGFERLLVINSEFHMPRTEKIFRWVYGLSGPGRPCVVEFETVPDTGVDARALEARKTKEAAGIAALEPLVARITTLAQFHEWLFGDHEAYAGAPEAPARAPVDLGTY